MSEPYGYVWTSIKDGMEIRFTRMYPNEFYKPTDITPVYKTPQRNPLTDEEISEIAINNPPMVHEFARAIEAAHGIRPTDFKE